MQSALGDPVTQGALHLRLVRQRLRWRENAPGLPHFCNLLVHHFIPDLQRCSPIIKIASKDELCEKQGATTLTTKTFEPRRIITVKRTSARIWAAAMLTFVLAMPVLTASAQPVPGAYVFDFATTVKPWEASSDRLPVDEHTLTLKTDEKGNSFAALSVNKPGSMWVMTTFPTNMNTAKITFDARNMDFSASKLMVPIVYIGNMKPTSISQFEVAGTGLIEGWQTYEYKVPIKAEKGALIAIALGYKTYQAGWAAIDNIKIMFYNQ